MVPKKTTPATHEDFLEFKTEETRIRHESNNKLQEIVNSFDDQFEKLKEDNTGFKYSIMDLKKGLDSLNDQFEKHTKHEEEYQKQTRDDMEKGFTKLEGKFDEILKGLDAKYAGKPVEWIVYGLVGLILTAVFGAIIGTVIINK